MVFSRLLISCLLTPSAKSRSILSDFARAVGRSAKGFALLPCFCHSGYHALPQNRMLKLGEHG